jgi:pyruvate/2-oxoglutarate dehydrogenase complex dihydrolipoamide dehydrogenase (E3) component
MNKHYDNLIIGFGKGGKTLAAWLANQGRQVALIETSEKMYGGSCINIACIPTKSLIVSGEKELSYQTAYEEKNELTSLLRERSFESLDGLDLVTVITGTASFVSSNEVRVITAGNEQTIIKAKRIFINTGSKPFIPDIPGIRSSKKVFTSTSLMEQPVLAEKLVIIGGGFIGLEFAGMYARFGAQVTILDRGTTFLPHEDEGYGS